jgi:HlyD family type I secretion membrane fusion protein
MTNPTPEFSVQRHLALGLGGLALLILGFGGWASFSEISGAVIAPGQIEVDQNRQVVQHPDGGVVAQILAQEGDSVRQGQLLIQLDATRLGSELAIIEGQLFELMARRGRLEAERDDKPEPVYDMLLRNSAASNADAAVLMAGQSQLLAARRASRAQEVAQLAKRRSQIDTQITGISAQSQALGQQLELIEQELKDQQTLLDRGLAQAGRVLALRREQARLSGQLGELTAQRALAQERATEIELEVIKLRTQQREEAITRLRDLQFRELELAEQRRALLDQRDRLAIRAPASGIIYGLQVTTPRSVIRAAEPVMFIIPQDRPLVIAARVDPIHIDKITLGQPVNLRFSALDQRTTPELTGEVAKVSPDAFVDQARGLSYYRAEITLPEAEQAKLPENIRLLPGMPVEAFIRTGDRTPLAYLTKPLTDYFSKAFRDG